MHHPTYAVVDSGQPTERAQRETVHDVVRYLPSEGRHAHPARPTTVTAGGGRDDRPDRPAPHRGTAATPAQPPTVGPARRSSCQGTSLRQSTDAESNTERFTSCAAAHVRRSERSRARPQPRKGTPTDHSNHQSATRWLGQRHPCRGLEGPCAVILVPATASEWVAQRPLAEAGCSLLRALVAIRQGSWIRVRRTVAVVPLPRSVLRGRRQRGQVERDHREDEPGSVRGEHRLRRDLLAVDLSGRGCRDRIHCVRCSKTPRRSRSVIPRIQKTRPRRPIGGSGLRILPAQPRPQPVPALRARASEWSHAPSTTIDSSTISAITRNCVPNHHNSMIKTVPGLRPILGASSLVNRTGPALWTLAPVARGGRRGMTASQL